MTSNSDIDTSDVAIQQAQATWIAAKRIVDTTLSEDAGLMRMNAGAWGKRDAGPIAFFCAGNCGKDVAARGGYCAECGAEDRRRVQAMFLAGARESLSPNGALDWCRVANDKYIKGTVRALALAKTCASARRAVELIQSAFWKLEHGNLLFIGPKRIGKTNTAIAIGHKMLDAATSKPMRREVFEFIAGIRFVTGIELGRARTESKMGDEPAIVRRAKNATLLILDEIGFEDDKMDPHAVRDVVFHRYRFGNQRPSIVTSGATKEQLALRYGASMVERLTDLGELIDLHKS